MKISKDLKEFTNTVVQSYRDGKPVAVFSREGGILHGEGNVLAILQPGATLEGVFIYIDRDWFEANNLSEFCEAARKTWLEKQE